MDRRELVALLQRAGVPGVLFDLPGVYDVPMQLDAYYFLRQDQGSWVVGLRERGEDKALSWFVTEADACDA